MSGKKLTSKQAEKVYSWILDRQISWGVVLLTCLVGLIELLPAMDSPTSSFAFFVLLDIVYAGLASVLSYSIWYLGRLFRAGYEANTFLESNVFAWLRTIQGKHQGFLLSSVFVGFCSLVNLLVWAFLILARFGYV